MSEEKVRNTYKTRAKVFFNNDQVKIEKFQKYFNWDNEDLVNLVDSPRLNQEERDVIASIIDFNRVNVKSKSDTNGKSNLPFTRAALEVTQALLSMRVGDRIKIESTKGSGERELVSVQVLVKYKNPDGSIKTKSLDRNGNGITIEV